MDLFHPGEGAVIGSVLNNPSLYHKVSWLEPENFNFPTSREIWKTIKECAAEGMEINVLSIVGRNPEIRETYLEEAIDRRVPDNNIQQDAKLIYDTWRLRKYKEVAQHIEYGLSNGARKNPSTFISSTTGKITEINRAQSAESGTRAVDVLEGTLKAIVDTTDPLTTPWPGINSYARIRPSDVLVLGARPSLGKTAFACQWMIHLCKLGIPCSFFSLETSKEQIGKRLLTIQSATKINGVISDAVKTTASRMKTLPFFVYDSIYNINDIISTIALLKASEGVKVFFIDYLQLVESNYTNDVAYTCQTVGKISRQFKIAANTLGITIVLVSQLNRDVERRASKRPSMADLRDSGTIEQDASHVWLLYPKTEEMVGLIISKQKDGPTGEVNIRFNKEIYTFEEC